MRIVKKEFVVFLLMIKQGPDLKKTTQENIKTLEHILKNI